MRKQVNLWICLICVMVDKYEIYANNYQTECIRNLILSSHSWPLCENIDKNVGRIICRPSLKTTSNEDHTTLNGLLQNCLHKQCKENLLNGEMFSVLCWPINHQYQCACSHNLNENSTLKLDKELVFTMSLRNDSYFSKHWILKDRNSNYTYTCATEVFYQTKEPIFHLIEVTNGVRSRSTAGPLESCLPETYAMGFDVKIQARVSSGDNTAMNGALLLCSHQSLTITSTVGPWGNWQGIMLCPTGQYIVAYQLQVQTAYRGGVNMKVLCRGLYSSSAKRILHHIHEEHGSWGEWSEECPIGSAVCGIVTWVQPEKHELGDDTALDDVQMYCC